MRSLSSFVCIETTFAFFQRLGIVFLRLQFLNMIASSFTILSSHSFNILMDTSSCPWASNVWIIFYISLSSISKDYTFVSVIYIWFSGNLLSFGKGLHWDKKYLLKRLKFVTIFPFTERGKIIGIFLPS